METNREAYRKLFLIRAFEEKLEALFAKGKIPGFVHTYIGQEAIAVGVCANLRTDDYVTSTHRGHGHAIAKGIDLNGLMAEVFGKVTGICKGRGGSMHVADFSKGILGANGIVAAGTVIAAGAGLSIQTRQEDQVVICFFGDGGINKGTVHEAMNFCSVKKLPVVFVCENNQYAQFTSRKVTTSVSDLSLRGAAYGIPAVSVDGNDLLKVVEVSKAAIADARAGIGPTLVVADTYRFGGHYVGDQQAYRSKEEVAERRRRDPLLLFEDHLVQQGLADKEALESERESILELVDKAVAFAEQSEYPEVRSVTDYVFTDGTEA
ncbi:MAG: thiamine pyrophosphate-dependent dehydrogenase E1 component subunit alpha [Gemmatimonadetes bacterium]|nr:pyruvate dehydrogenase (acetyl-transferring) E1 component subunit alpha [Gemmatimonadota bacterium]MCH2460822.1 thiamine pyrophosphate-dependent dehydrogenase E1 component subunit alpha [Gemmatimonadota bacterium]